MKLSNRWPLERAEFTLSNIRVPEKTTTSFRMIAPKGYRWAFTPEDTRIFPKLAHH